MVKKVQWDRLVLLGMLDCQEKMVKLALLALGDHRAEMVSQVPLAQWEKLDCRVCKESLERQVPEG